MKLSVALAATDADFETGDFLQIYVDTDASGAFQLIADYLGNDIKVLEDNLSVPEPSAWLPTIVGLPLV